MNRPNIYNYLNYRFYLADMFHFRKKDASYFSHRYFSNKAGFASPNFLKLVVDNQRNLTNASIAKVAKGFDLNKKEREFFEYMVFMNQAGTHDEKNHYYRKMIAISGLKKVNTIAKDQYEYFSKWYYPVIREILVFEAGVDTPEQIAAKLIPKITPKQVESALQLLERLNLIKKNPDGSWEQIDEDISTGPEIKSMTVANFHKEMLLLAGESIDRFSASQRDISGLTLSIRRESLPEMKAKLISMRTELLGLASSEKDPDMVVQINIQLFPVTK